MQSVDRIVARWGILLCPAVAKLWWTSVAGKLTKFISNELLLERSGARAGRNDVACLSFFESDPRLLNASGWSLFAEGWQQQLQQCLDLQARYVLYAPGVKASRKWVQDISSTGVAGKWLGGFWGGERHATLLPKLDPGLRLMGVCVPSRCSRRCELSLGWHVLLLKSGNAGALDTRLPAPVRGRVRLRMSRPEDALRAEQLKTLLERLDPGNSHFSRNSRMPSWYLDPPAWPARPARGAFAARTATFNFFRDVWSVFTYRMHVNHQYRYGLCSIPKVGLMQFFLMNQHLSGRNLSYEDVLQSEARVLDRSIHGLLSQVYWKSREWKLAVFVRDPLERFLSAFLDKCMRPSGNCPETDRRGWARVTLKSPIDEQVEAFRSFASQPLPTPFMLTDDHWIPQSLYLSWGCNFVWQRINFVGLLTSDRLAVNWQILEMLHTVFGLSLKLAEHLADTYFPPTGHASQMAAQRVTSYHEDSETVFSRFYDQEIFLRCL